jgi:hypothetical protein
MAPAFTATKLDISVPNATVIRLWSNNWVSCKANAASADDSVGMTVGELAWASALPTYQYDSSNKISAINGSALANYELPTSVSAATDVVTANSGDWNSVTGKLETTAFSDVSGTFLTSLPADVAYTGWVENSIVSATSGLQSSGNYIPYTATEDSLTAFETNSGLLIRHAIGGGLNSTYIGDNVQVHYVNGGPQTLKGAVLGYNKLSFETNSDTAYVDKGKIHKWDSASNYIQNSSATINEVNANYQTNSGSFLTAVDLTPYQTTAGMTAYQEAGDYYSASNPSGFISEVPAGTMNESAFEYDANDKISGYNGSAFAGGSELPQSATEAIETVTSNSADWNATTDTVSSNSGAWGGSALPISAGPGIKFSMVDNTLVASTDETVLWSGTKNTTAGAETLSESYMNFDKIDIYLTFDTASEPQRAQSITRYYVGNHTTAQPLYVYATANNIAANTLTAETLYISGSPNGTGFSLLAGIRQVNSTVTTGITTYNCNLKQIVGINRKSGV